VSQCLLNGISKYGHQTCECLEKNQLSAFSFTELNKTLKGKVVANLLWQAILGGGVTLLFDSGRSTWLYQCYSILSHSVNLPRRKLAFWRTSEEKYLQEYVQWGRNINSP